MKFLNLYITIFLLLATTIAHAIMVEGNVQDKDGNPVPFARISTQESKKNALCDADGNFSISLAVGTHFIEISALGFYTKSIQIDVKANQKNHFAFILDENPSELGEIEIHANTRDIARHVMHEASKKSDLYKSNYENISLESYQKISLHTLGPDTTHFEEKIDRDTLPYISIQRNLLESYSEIKKQKNKYREQIIAAKDYSRNPPSDDLSISISMEFGEHNIAPQQWMYANTYLLNSNTGYFEFDFNQNLLDLPGLAEKPYLSPLAATASINYQFDLIGTYYVDSKKYYRIKVTPIWKSEALFEGEVVIENETWALIKVDLNATPRSLKMYAALNVKQEMKQFGNDIYFPERTAISYQIKEGKTTYFGSVLVARTEISFPAEFEENTFSNETQYYTPEAFNRDSAYWNVLRTDSVNTLQQSYISECDSLQAYYTSDEYYHEQDSTFNDVRFMDFILYGVGFKNRARREMYYFYPLAMQVNPVGIGGYRHKFGAAFSKEFQNNYLLETNGEVDYGFRNRDIRGKVGVGLTYVPRKFVRTFIRVGDFYDMINTYASLGSIFSRSNYVRTQSFSVAQRMELVNGLFAELSLEFSDQKPINNLQQDLWSQQLFGDVNTPLTFERYIKSEIRLDLLYRIKQKYIIKKGKKIIQGTQYPEFHLTYRKGVPGLFNSEVNFDFVEVGVEHDAELGRWGTAQWSMIAGSFLNKKNLRLLEYRYFRGSDVLFFSDPLRSFQLLGPTLSTPNAYLRGNYFHHLDGLFLNKIPLINRLKLTEAFGAAFLSIPDQQFYHAEMYVGLERVVRIRRELFRFGIYGASSATSLNRARFEFKFGINFYNTYSKKWSY
ncbi:MAG: DUF5686 family protein [Flavobacteriales bacterium]